MFEDFFLRCGALNYFSGQYSNITTMLIKYRTHYYPHVRMKRNV